MQNTEHTTQSEIDITLLSTQTQGEQKSTDGRTAHFVFIRRERVVSRSSWGRQKQTESGERQRSTCTCELLEKGREEEVNGVCEEISTTPTTTTPY